MTEVPRTHAPILVGTAAWSDHHDLYPPGVRGTERIRHYARHFPVVEVNASYYAILPQRNYQSWVDRTPDDFTFNVKALGLLTGHVRGEVATPEAFNAFRDSYQPLRDAGKLGAVLFQFPPWFDRTAANRDRIAHCVDMMAGDLLLIEFRNSSWLAEGAFGETIAFLRDLGVSYVTVDAPQTGTGTSPCVPAVTNERLGYLRLHGRNAATWYNTRGSSSGDRFDYLYSDEELAELAGVARWLAERANVVHVIFNNNVDGQGIRNARTIMRMLGLEPPEDMPVQSKLEI